MTGLLPDPGLNLAVMGIMFQIGAPTNSNIDFVGQCVQSRAFPPALCEQDDVLCGLGIL